MRFAIISTLLFFTGCATPVASLHVQGAWFTPGETVQVELRNESSFFRLHHGVLSCFTHLQVQRDGAWAAAPEPEKICILPLLITPPATNKVYAYLLHERLAAGVYRFAFEVTRGPFSLFGLPIGGEGEDKVLTTEPFEIRARR